MQQQDSPSRPRATSSIISAYEHQRNLIRLLASETPMSSSSPGISSSSSTSPPSSSYFILLWLSIATYFYSQHNGWTLSESFYYGTCLSCVDLLFVHLDPFLAHSFALYFCFRFPPPLLVLSHLSQLSNLVFPLALVSSRRRPTCHACSQLSTFSLELLE